jgi:hypothetical protein
MYVRNRERVLFIQGYFKRSTHFQIFILQKLLTLNTCPVSGWKGNLSKLWFESRARCARNNSVCQGPCVQNGGKRTGESFLRSGIRQDVSVKCATTFSDTSWKHSANRKVYLRLVQVWEELDYRFDICRVTRGAHIECL